MVEHSETIKKIKVGPLTAVIVSTLRPCATFHALCLTLSFCLSVCLSLFSSSLGYNTVVRIPAGATNIDIKQVSYSGKPEDDNYLGECAACASVK